APIKEDGTAVTARNQVAAGSSPNGAPAAAASSAAAALQKESLGLNLSIPQLSEQQRLSNE
ncbi:hypothetical protein Pmar_PMAR023093, partial [Perkinsus marinus ATCC 50983]